MEINMFCTQPPVAIRGTAVFDTSTLAWRLLPDPDKVEIYERRRSGKVCFAWKTKHETSIWIQAQDA